VIKVKHTTAERCIGWDPFLQKYLNEAVILRLRRQRVNANPESARPKTQLAIENRESHPRTVRREAICAYVTFGNARVTVSQMRYNKQRVALITVLREDQSFPTIQKICHNTLALRLKHCM
jgi:hypothetical protein